MVAPVVLAEPSSCKALAASDCFAARGEDGQRLGAEHVEQQTNVSPSIFRRLR
jgi:hypothetical protein